MTLSSFTACGSNQIARRIKLDSQIFPFRRICIEAYPLSKLPDQALALSLPKLVLHSPSCQLSRVVACTVDERTLEFDEGK